MSPTQQRLRPYPVWIVFDVFYTAETVLFGLFLMTSTQQKLCPYPVWMVFDDFYTAETMSHILRHSFSRHQWAGKEGRTRITILPLHFLFKKKKKLFVCFLNPENLMLNACGKTSCLYACKNSLCKRTECIHISQQDCTKGSGYVSIICPHLCVEYAHIYTITGYLFLLQAKPAEEYVNNSSSWIFLSKKQQQHFISVQTQDLSVSVFM